MFSVNCPGTVNWITPPQLHMHLEVLFSAGMLSTITVAEPGVQGAAVAGTQGIGVSTPSAAEVAEATVGFASEVHIPKGGMFTIGLLHMMFAQGMNDELTGRGVATKLDGATPKLHIIIAPVTTC